jgi:dTDP-glucose 4,6-dehydratase
VPPIDPRDRSPRPPLPTADLQAIVDRVGPLWSHVQGKTILVTGATGFFGSWLLESFARANRDRKLNATVLALSRNPDAFRRRVPFLADDRAIQFVQGDIADFAFPDRPIDLIIHAAVESTNQPTPDYARHMLDSVLLGTRRILELASQQKVAPRILLTSSGAVYGRQPPSLSHIPEDFTGSPDPLDPNSAYGLAKRTAENWCIVYQQRYGIVPLIARCFAFAGPLLPFEGTYAIGNFIRDAMSGGPIKLSGDGSPMRSFLYSQDLAVWLWTVLLKGQPSRAYNVGSESAISILDLARLVAKIALPRSNPNDIITMGNPPRTLAELIAANQLPPPNPSPARYVPSTRRAQEELNLGCTVEPPDAIQRTIDWARQG